MRNVLAIICILALTGACDDVSSRVMKRSTRLTQAEFIEVYAKLARATSETERQNILRQHGTSEAELQEFVAVNIDDLPNLSATFDSVVARLGADQEEGTMPTLPR
jgi:hypothetical protein